jgi:predicted TIM-barrel fold metal-dependent hydrolase
MSSSHTSRRRFLTTAASAACASAAASLGDRTSLFADPPSGDVAIPIVDCHLHINHFDRSIDDTIKHMDATGTSKAFVLPLETGEGGVLLRSETVLHAFHEYKDRVIPFCQTDIRSPDVLSRVRAYHLLGCRGVGEQKEHLPLNDRRVERLIALCDDLDWPITMHFQDGPGGYNQGLAEHLETYLKRYKKVRIIGHAQTWWANISADVPPAAESLYPTGPVKAGGLLDKLLSDYPNLYADMSAGSGFNALSRDREFTAGFIERHPKQMLFGSDCPCYDGNGKNFKGTCYSMQLQSFIRELVTDQVTLKDIFHDNAMRALEGTA